MCSLLLFLLPRLLLLLLLLLCHEQEGAVMDYGSLIYTTLQMAKTAQDAIHIADRLMQTYGYASEGESFSIADQVSLAATHGTPCQCHTMTHYTPCHTMYSRPVYVYYTDYA